MGSPERSCGVASPGSAGTASPRRGTMPRSEGAVSPCPAAGGLRCRAVLVLAVCLSATALPHSLGSLVALSPGCSPRRGTSGTLVAANGDLLSHPTTRQPGRVQAGAEGTSGCFCGEEGSCRGTDAGGLSLGTPTGAAVPELGAGSVLASYPPASGTFSDGQRGAAGAGAPTRSRKGQEQAVSPSPGQHPMGMGPSPMGEDHAAPHLEPLPGTSPALPSERTSSLVPTRPGTALAPSAAPSGGLWGTRPAGTSEEQSDPSSSPACQALPPSSEAHPAPAWTRAPSTTGPAEAGVSSATPDATPEPAATKSPCEDGAATVASWSPEAAGVTRGSPLELRTQMSSPAGPPEPTVGSAPPGFNPLAPKHRASTSSSPSSSRPPATTTHALSSQTPAAPAAVASDAQPTSDPSLVAPQHPSAARGVPTATSWLPAGGTFAPGAIVAASDPGSAEAKPPEHPLPVRVLPLRFRLLGVAYTEALSRRSSGSYRELEKEVRLMLNHLLSTYETFLQANVLEFTNGSVRVRGEALFRGDAPTNSHLIRTLVTGASRGGDAFRWRLEPQSVWSDGFSLENLDPEKLSVSLTALQLGRGGTEPLERLVSEVTRALGVLYRVRNFTVGQLRNLGGDLQVTGDVYLDTVAHADVTAVLQALTALATSSVDLSSLSVEGARLHLQVYPISFLVTNRRFSEDLLDPLAKEHRELTRALGDAVARALRDCGRFLQAVIRGFLPGSLICHGDVVFQRPAPTSLEVLEAFALAVGPDEVLAGSEFQVDPYSIAVGEDTLEPPPAPGLPEYGVAIMVVCGLGIVTLPVVLLVCLRSKRFGWSDVAILWDRRDPEVGTQTLEMENQGFGAASEQDTEEAPACWQEDSA